MSKEILKIDHVSKEYRLGMIGGTSFICSEELQRKRAARKGLEDPTRKVTDTSSGKIGERFLALDDINLTICQGERVGIIGHNGAGKSTLLKLISRITAPSAGTITMNGRVASMLEVGTGFHPELTGRENIYMNGAILGMTRAEIDAKIEDIIDFSECRRFIDTPVKRYSSGMYVKLAFAVAAHLDAEIMIMDEVLAVGDVAFQRKCLNKMSQLAVDEGRTVLYVSHNMATIRQLCTRCVVLEHGKLVYDGDVEEAINNYYDATPEAGNYHESVYNTNGFEGEKCRALSLEADNHTGMEFTADDRIAFMLRLGCGSALDNVLVQFVCKTGAANLTGSTFADRKMDMAEGINVLHGSMPLAHFTPGQYNCDLILYQVNHDGAYVELDRFKDALTFSIAQSPAKYDGNYWWHRRWGFASYDDIMIDKT